MLDGDLRPQPVKGSAHPRRLEQPRALQPASASANVTATATAAAAATAVVGGSGVSAAAGPRGWETAGRRLLGASLRLLGQTARELML